MVDKKEKSDQWFWVFVIVIAIIRLVLTGDRDILALNSPHDEYWYIQSAINQIWGGDSYNQMTFMHLPIYSIWLYCIHLLGIPVRLAIDIAWLFSIGYLAFGFLRLTRMVSLAAFIFTFLAFHPYTISVFDRALAETFLTVIYAAVIAAGIELWNCREKGFTFRHSMALVVYILGFAIAYHTRKEGIVLVAPLLVLACWSWIDRQRWWFGSGKQRLAIPLLIAPILSMIFLGAIVAGVNYLKWGVFARYDLASQGYQRAVGALNSIDSGPTPQYITVTKEMLSLAYKESPTFHELQASMEGPVGKGWIAIAKPYTSQQGEIGNGWFYWALRDVAANAGWHSDAKVADSKYAATADELENAFAKGRLKKKAFVISSFLDPDIGKWLPELPSSIFNVLQLVVRPQLDSLTLPIENASLKQFDQYIAVTGRRTSPPRVEVNGWIIAPVGSLTGLGKDNSVFSWERLGTNPRPDVPGAFAFNVSSIGLDLPTELHILLPDGSKGSVKLTAINRGGTSFFSGTVHTQFGIDGLKSNLRPHRVDKWFTKLCTLYDWLGYLICLVTLSSIVLIGIQRKASEVVLVMLLMIVAITARITLFGILDASSWSGLQARYILPIIPAFVCIGGLGMAFIFSFLQNIFILKMNSYYDIN
jgi:hypothetical protein